METRSRGLANRPLIAFQCAALAVLILCSGVRAMYRDVSAVAGQGVAAGFYSPWKITGYSDTNRCRAPNIQQNNSLTLQINVRHMNGTLGPEPVSLRTLPPSWNLAGLDEFYQDGWHDILWNNSVSGKVAILHANDLLPRERDPFSVRAPPSIAVRYCHRNGDPSPYINGGHILVPSFTGLIFLGGAPGRLISSSLYIRAPPTPMPHC